MSSIRLFILDAFARHGEMHGHQLRLLAEQEHVHLWTDISVGSLYGAIKRLAGENLLVEARTEREGGYPERVVYALTSAGRSALTVLERQEFDRVVLRPDPFDLALARPDPQRLDELGDALADRLATLESMVAQVQREYDQARPYLSVGETHALLHRERRLRAEIDWHRELIEDLPAVIADERARRPDPLPDDPPSRDPLVRDVLTGEDVLPGESASAQRLVQPSPTEGLPR